jgi:hypothetical protein
MSLFGNKTQEATSGNRRTAAGSTGTTTTPTQGRTRPPDAPIIGYAVPRTTAKADTIGGTSGPPSLEAGGARDAAHRAGEEMRKRARAGSLHVQLPPGATSSSAVFRPRTLVGL